MKNETAKKKWPIDLDYGQGMLQIMKLICLKILENPKTIDLTLTNRPIVFFNSDTRETGLSDFHK